MLRLRYVFRKGLGEAKAQWSSFSLDEYLVSRSNSALAISLAGYIIAVAMALTGVIDCPDDNVGMHGLWVVTYTAFGMLLLFCAQQINNRVRPHHAGRLERLVRLGRGGLRHHTPLLGLL